MWKNNHVVMLPTQSKAVRLGQLVIGAGNNLFSSRQSNDIGSLTAYELYITSDEEIKVGDWYLANDCNHKNDTPIYIVRKCDNITNGWLESNSNIGQGDNPDWSSKIIATTDTSLRRMGDNGIVDIALGLEISYIPESFIKYFIEEYNKGNVITKVMIEDEDCGTIDSTCGLIPHISTEGDTFYMGAKLKVNSNNTINIKPIKDSWNREEHIANIKAFAKEFVANTDTAYKQADIDKWIENNL